MCTVARGQKVRWDQNAHLCTELVDGLWGKSPTSQGGQGEKPRVVPVADYVVDDEFLYLSLGDDSVEEVHATILPLDRTVQVQGIAEPVVGGASACAGREVVRGEEGKG